MKFIGYYNKTVWLSYFGMLSALVGIYHIQNLRIAMICLIISGIADLFDGVVARRFKRSESEKNFGIQLDSLVDTVSFLLFPAVFLLHTLKIPFAIAAAALYVFCGITRLAWFNITTYENIREFHGMPVTYAALIIPLFNLTKFFGIKSFYEPSLCALYVIISLLFVLDLKIRKPTIAGYVFFSLLAIIVTGVYIIF